METLKNPNFSTIAEFYERGRKAGVYKVFEIDLITARVDEEVILGLDGNFIWFVQLPFEVAANVRIRFDKDVGELIPCVRGTQIDTPFARLYFTNNALGASQVCRFLVSENPLTFRGNDQYTG